MNNLLQVKLRFTKENNTQQPNGRNLTSHAETTTKNIQNLCDDLRSILSFYDNSPKLLNHLMIDVNYNDIIAKSKRIQELLKPKGQQTNDLVVGARFSNAPEGMENHIITYYVDRKTVENTLKELEIAMTFLNKSLNGVATAKNFNKPANKLNYEGYSLSETKIRNIIVDCSVVESFSVPSIKKPSDKENFLVTFYKTELSVTKLLEKLKVDSLSHHYSFYGEDTLSVNKELFDLLEKNVPYLISMVSTDLSKITLYDLNITKAKETIHIPAPGNEPTIGVIDTLFDETVYFSDWVDNTDYLTDIEKLMERDSNRNHGTAVSSLIVDGPRLNPWLDDGCGRFKVRHFGVCSERISTVKLVHKIREIISNNPDIHVWNLSLGTDDEVSKNFISYDAAFLDELQAHKNLIFVISGTNDNRNQKKGRLKVGSPADSLNAIVVNSVRRDNTPASYTRKGNILSFFHKPDVSYYGGDFDERITVYTPDGESEEYGTSFAAPWISRKLCYLIDVIGLQREVAKALIIDSAAGWEYKLGGYKNQELLGYGIVPIDISRMLSSESREIRFLIYGTSQAYKTANYSIPVPKDDDNKYPYIARATLCYFPECSRNQGVDYTNRELSIKFGRVDPKGKIIDINENVQDESKSYTTERQSRKDFRKWENTKFISKILKANQPIISYGEHLWGFSIISKERLTNKMNKELNFGAVVTLREINGINRIEDFIKACTLRGWIVNEINVQNQINLYNTNQEEILWE